jgi:hypothetical protein
VISDDMHVPPDEQAELLAEYVDIALVRSEGGCKSVRRQMHVSHFDCMVQAGCEVEPCVTSQSKLGN